jgi:hypothetical protein
LNEEAYAIQIYALHNFRKNINMNNLDSFLVFKTNDGYYKYIFGQFPSEDASGPDLEKTRNSGFKDAFVTRIKKFKESKLIYKRKK